MIQVLGREILNIDFYLFLIYRFWIEILLPMGNCIQVYNCNSVGDISLAWNDHALKIWTKFEDIFTVLEKILKQKNYEALNKISDDI